MTSIADVFCGLVALNSLSSDVYRRCFLWVGGVVPAIVSSIADVFCGLVALSPPLCRGRLPGFVGDMIGVGGVVPAIVSWTAAGN